MSEPTLTIFTVLDNKSIEVAYTNNTTAEDVCIYVCKTLNIGPSARHLFALRIAGKSVFLTPSALFGSKYVEFDFRIRFKVSKLQNLRKLDIRAYDYFFHQTRLDVLDNKVPDIVYDKCKRELVGLGITDMYRVMLEKDIPKESVENDYKKYIPKEVLKRHAFFIKKPIRETLGKLQRTKHDVWFVKEEYLNQLNILAPEYLAETYKAVTDLDGSSCNILLKVSPGNNSSDSGLPEIKFCLESKKDQWQLIGTIEEMAFVSIRIDGTVEINRKNGIPFYLKFNSLPVMWSFISHLDGYYRLACKWTFNICKDATTPSLEKLYMMKCHGPVGGEFSYAKLEEKRLNRPGCFIIRESEAKYNQYFIDVCIKNSSKPKTFKLEKINKDEYIFNDDLTRYKSIQQLVAAYNDENAPIYFQECLPPSDYDESPLLLCRKEDLSGAALTDASALNSLVPNAPLCIDCKDLQIYKYKKCLKWNKNRKKVERDGQVVGQEKFNNIYFPDLELSKAGKKCRNPDGDPGGPWCFVEKEGSSVVEKEFCDIPLCDDPLCVVFTKNYQTYMHFTDFNMTLDALNFGVKLWSSDQYLEAEARLVLSVVALPMDKKMMENLGTSIEIYISNKYCALTINNKDQVEKETTNGILKSSQYTYFSLTWHRGFITLFKAGFTKPIFLAEYKTKNNLMGFRLNQFSYYSAQGTNILWTFPFCLDDFECDVHTTTGHLFQQYWPLREKNIRRELSFHIRAVRSARILLTTSPVSEYPYILVHFKADDGYSRVILKEHRNAPSITLKELILSEILDYWNWQEYSLSFFGSTLQIYWTKTVGGGHLIMELEHEAFSKMRWFSVCSDNSVAHWTFFCVPPKISKPPPAFLPECSINSEETYYNGTQDVTKDGFPCLPWSASSLIPDSEHDFLKGDSSLKELSYCRDPGQYHKGTYCYVISMLPELKILKKHCHIRKCKSQECRIAGTGNDYIGTLNISRSRRYCEPWYSPTPVHPHDIHHMDISLFPDESLEDANSFCRNPSRNAIGPWCYTIDPSVPKESCLVKDCDKPEECIIIITGRNEGRKIYILPQWKERGASGGIFFALKQWDPDKIEGLSIEITPKSRSENIRLEIGAVGNQKIFLFYNGQLMKEKTLPHLLASGSWTDFWLQVRQEEIMLGYKGVPHPLFEWKHYDIENAFEPTYISFSTLADHYIGIYFKCDECHTEYTSVNNALKIFPVGAWMQEGINVYNNFSLKIRGSGTVWLALYNLIHTENYLYLEINQNEHRITLHKILYYQPSPLKQTMINGLLLHEEYWTNYTVLFSETNLNLFKNGTIIFEFEAAITEPILIYYFSLGVEDGLIIWSVNCQLLDIDGPPRDGGWSPWSDWTCTVPCGGGDGFRTRTCSNPRPNIRGKLCLGTPVALGKCNDFECGDISPKTMNKIREDLRNNMFSLIVKEGDSVNIPNNKEILKTIEKESPKSHYEWSLNGMLVNEEKDRVSLRNGEIFISIAKIVDSGVYVCVLYRINKKRLIFRIVSLSVIPSTYSVITRATKKLSFNCRAVTLGFVYSNLALKIKINETVHKDYGIVMLAAANVYNVPNLAENYTGDWKCVIEQRDLHFSWTTNYMKILVKKAPNLYIHLMEDELTKPLFGWLGTEKNVLSALIAIVSGSIIIVTISLLIYFKFLTFKRRSYKKNRRM